MNFKAGLVDKFGMPLTGKVNVNLNYATNKNLKNLIGNNRTNTKYSPQQVKNYAVALFGSIYGYGNAGKYRNRYYALSDTNNGLDSYSRELLVRWCREMTAQLPVIKYAIDTLTNFAVGDAYDFDYVGNNPEWGKQAKDYIHNVYYPRCCTRGKVYDFKKVVEIVSKTCLTDGDMLKIYGQDKTGFPMFQLIPSHRIKSYKDNYIINDGGVYDNCIISDGVVYRLNGEVVGYCVENSQNLVNTMAGNLTDEVIFSANDSRLIGDLEFIDKARALPKVGYAVLQAMTIQELDSYLMDKLKIESLVGLIETTPDGTAPVELQNTLTALIENDSLVGNTLQLSPQDHALEVTQGPDIRYIKAMGGDIKTLSGGGVNDQTSNYMTRLEQQITATLGVPHQILFSLTEVGGRITSAPAEIFRINVRKQQAMLDKYFKPDIAIALAKGIKLGYLKENNGESLLDCFQFTHPYEFSLDNKYDADIVLNNLENGVISMNEACQKLSSKSYNQVIEEQKSEQILFYTSAKEVSETTGIDLQSVISNWKKTPVKVSITKAVDDTTTEDSINNENTK